MRLITAGPLCLLVPAVFAVLASAATSVDAPRVRIVDQSPPTLRGEGFKPAERISLRVTLGSVGRIRAIRADSRGTFEARFVGLVLDRCSKSLAVKAVGAAGDRAGFTLQTLPCPNGATR